MRGRWDAHMLTIAECCGECALEFAAVVGLPNQIAQRDSITIQMLLNARSENSTGRCAAFFGERPEQQAAANIARGVLNSRQAALLSLRQVVRNIVENLGIG